MSVYDDIDDIEKFRRAKALALSRRQSEADIAKQRREGISATTVPTADNDRNPNETKDGALRKR
jgi:hypothetical protein